MPAGLHAALLHAPVGVNMTVVINPELAFGSAGVPTLGGSLVCAIWLVGNKAVFRVTSTGGGRSAGVMCVRVCVLCCLLQVSSRSPRSL